MFSTLTSYDAVPYSSHPYAHSHPRNLAALATLFGVSAPDVRNCRVLEIGCGSGGNLLPMAIALPDAQLLGIDASGRQVKQGQDAIDTLGLTNVRLQRRDILEFDPSLGEFDYIICHGVYSWVTAEVQEKILDICQQHLASTGVAYISYNTYPGWYLRRGVREMMHYHAQGFDDTKSKIDQSRALMNFLSSAVESDGSAHAMQLYEELQVLSSCDDSYLFHEHLESHNEPLFFHQFVERAARHGLRFLCEAQFSSMVPNDLSEQVQQTLSEIAPDIIQMEQYLDFVRNRKFRQTLLCHRNIELDRTIEPMRVRNLFVASQLSEAESDDERLSDGDSKTFEHSGGQLITVTTPIEQSAFTHLARIWPEEIAVSELADLAWQETAEDERPTREECRLEIAAAILQCYSAGIASLSAIPAGAISAVSSTPVASKLARYQADGGPLVTNARHQTVRLTDFERFLLVRLDGSVSVEALADEVCRLVSDQELTVEIEGIADPTPDDLRDAVQTNLKRMARSSLLLQYVSRRR